MPIIYLSMVKARLDKTYKLNLIEDNADGETIQTAFRFKDILTRLRALKKESPSFFKEKKKIKKIVPEGSLELDSDNIDFFIHYLNSKPAGKRTEVISEEEWKQLTSAYYKNQYDNERKRGAPLLFRSLADYADSTLSFFKNNQPAAKTTLEYLTKLYVQDDKKSEDKKGDLSDDPYLTPQRVEKEKTVFNAIIEKRNTHLRQTITSKNKLFGGYVHALENAIQRVKSDSTESTKLNYFSSLPQIRKDLSVLSPLEKYAGSWFTIKKHYVPLAKETLKKIKSLVLELSLAEEKARQAKLTEFNVEINKRIIDAVQTAVKEGRNVSDSEYITTLLSLRQRVWTRYRHEDKEDFLNLDRIKNVISTVKELRTQKKLPREETPLIPEHQSWFVKYTLEGNSAELEKIFETQNIINTSLLLDNFFPSQKSQFKQFSD